MATFYSQGNGAWSTLTNWDTNRAGGGTDPASANEAGMAGHTFVIQEGHAIEYDMDMSGWSGTTGLYALTIEGSAAGTPGTLYCKHSGDGTYWLKIQGGSATANIISGTNVTNLGRLLANSDGVWANSTALPNGRKFVIEFMGTTAGKLIDQYLDVKLLCTQPTNLYVHVYGTKYTFNANTGVSAANDTIDLGTTPPSAGTDVVLVPASGATLPTGLFADRCYYVRAVSGNTCKLSTRDTDTYIVDITAVGSGTINLLTEPASGAGTDALNVLEDVTSDAPWSATTGHNRAVLVDVNDPSSYDQQRVTISEITDADSIAISATIDSAQYAGCLLFLSSRNVSIRSNSTSSSQPIIDSVNVTRAAGNIYQCEIVNLAGTGTTFYGYGFNQGNAHTISGTISGCSIGIYDSREGTISAVIIACGSGQWYSRRSIYSGIFAGCSAALNIPQGVIISGKLLGCSTGMNYGNGCVFSGVSLGGSFCLYRLTNCDVSGEIWSSNRAFDMSSWVRISGRVSGCNVAFYACVDVIISGNVSGNTATFSDNNKVTVRRGATVDYVLSGIINTPGMKSRISIEEPSGVEDAARIYHHMGNILRTACDGATANYPDEDPDAGSGYAIEVSNLQSNINSVDSIEIIPNSSPHRVWLAADTWTITYKVYSTFNISDNNLVLEATYISAASPRTITVGTDSQAITAKTSDTDWTQTLSITITTAAAGWVDLDIYLKQYSAGGAVFIWPKPTIEAS